MYIYFYNMVRFIYILAVTFFATWMIWLFSDRPVIRRTVAAAGLLLLVFNKYIALGIYGILAWILQIILTVLLFVFLISLPIVLLIALIRN